VGGLVGVGVLHGGGVRNLTDDIPMTSRSLRTHTTTMRSVPAVSFSQRVYSATTATPDPNGHLLLTMSHTATEIIVKEQHFFSRLETITDVWHNNPSYYVFFSSTIF
jgi:hypothetical protein